ncbi:hypothetical protein [Candidatus Nitrosocosmicus sp. R]
MIRIKEGKPNSDLSEKVFLVLDNHSEIIYDSYPVVIKPPNMNHLMYKASIMEKQIKQW